MVEVIQTLGVGYLLFMLYLTFLYYKKNHYTIRSFLFWVAVWCGGVLMMIFPQSTSLLTQRLGVVRVTDFYLIVGLMFFSILCFLTYGSMRKTEARVEELVRKLAVKQPVTKRRR